MSFCRIGKKNTLFDCVAIQWFANGLKDCFKNALAIDKRGPFSGGR
jgi:hypothetical protein